MANIYDYIAFYKDTDFASVPWNIMDDLVCAIIAYTPAPNFTRTHSLAALATATAAAPASADVDKLVPQARHIIAAINHSRRYKGLSFSHLVNLTDEQTSFGAITCRLAGRTIVSFRGSNYSVSSWRENYRLFYQYPTVTHSLACRYLRQSLTLLDRHVRLVGHSKGGHLALTTALETPSLWPRLEQISNFDGPGLRAREYHSLKYAAVRARLQVFLPEYSWVGTMLAADNYHIIKTEPRVIAIHSPQHWQVFGQFFVPGTWSSASQQLHEITTVGLSQLDETKLAAMTDAAFALLGKKGTDNLSLRQFDLAQFYQQARQLDWETFAYLKNLSAVISQLRRRESKKK